MQFLYSTGAVAVPLGVLLAICVGRKRAVTVVPILSWVVPVLFGLMYLFEQELGERFGLVMIVPFLLLALAGAVLSLVGLVLLWKGGERPKAKGPLLVAAVVAATTPALAICML